MIRTALAEHAPADCVRTLRLQRSTGADTQPRRPHNTPSKPPSAGRTGRRRNPPGASGSLFRNPPNQRPQPRLPVNKMTHSRLIQNGGLTMNRRKTADSSLALSPTTQQRSPLIWEWTSRPCETGTGRATGSKRKLATDTLAGSRPKISSRGSGKSNCRGIERTGRNGSEWD